MIPRRAKKRDANEPEIIAALKAVGCSILQLDAIDLLVGRAGKNYLLEVKDGSKPPSGRKLTPKEETLMREWRGDPIAIVKNVEEAMSAVGLRKRRCHETVSSLQRDEAE